MIKFFKSILNHFYEAQLANSFISSSSSSALVFAKKIKTIYRYIL